jgi:hypothetical protein
MLHLLAQYETPAAPSPNLIPLFVIGLTFVVGVAVVFFVLLRGRMCPTCGSPVRRGRYCARCGGPLAGGGKR